MNNSFLFQPLYGEIVDLLPLGQSHRNDLLKAATDGELWKLFYTSVPCEKTIDDYIDFALSEKEKGDSFPFVVVHKGNKEIIGSTRYCHADVPNRRIEIGYTWYAKSYQKTKVNKECKYLLLKHAFEVMNCIAVIFQTNSLNHNSRDAILRLGARQDGYLRNHRINPDGTYRDTLLFSILENEWPSVKRLLDLRMNK